MKTPSDEITVEKIIKSYDNIEHKIEKLRVRSRNFTHGSDEIIKEIKATEKETKIDSEVLMKFTRSTIRVSNLIHEIIKGSSSRIENIDDVSLRLRKESVNKARKFKTDKQRRTYAERHASSKRSTEIHRSSFRRKSRQMSGVRSFDDRTGRLSHFIG